ncbi:hypothetical protein PMIN01_09249 [Paraphaeosphaeria minitans]|uniref:Uncharacterized protein n=1 Tax=Paraphaeosphaeria minitans TaxID=565426 RepID=A0A9P6GBY2_9PLEO|nr:hypothetical protein PMIN01_09249 [Paraphaeosphaeria minitans]
MGARAPRMRHVCPSLHPKAVRTMPRLTARASGLARLSSYSEPLSMRCGMVSLLLLLLLLAVLLRRQRALVTGTTRQWRRACLPSLPQAVATLRRACLPQSWRATPEHNTARVNGNDRQQLPTRQASSFGVHSSSLLPRLSSIVHRPSQQYLSVHLTARLEGACSSTRGGEGPKRPKLSSVLELDDSISLPHERSNCSYRVCCKCSPPSPR